MAAGACHILPRWPEAPSLHVKCQLQLRVGRPGSRPGSSKAHAGNCHAFRRLSHDSPAGRNGDVRGLTYRLRSHSSHVRRNSCPTVCSSVMKSDSWEDGCVLRIVPESIHGRLLDHILTIAEWLAWWGSMGSVLATRRRKNLVRIGQTVKPCRADL